MSKNKVRGPDLEKYLEQRGRNHNYLTYAQGARMYSLPYWTFVTYAKEADATWSLRKTAIVDTVMAKMPHYSINNQLLIMLQKPDAQICNSFSGWKNHKPKKTPDKKLQEAI